MYDTAALDGLRGVIAVHILLFHALLYSTLQWHIIGSAQVRVRKGHGPLHRCTMPESNSVTLGCALDDPNRHPRAVVDSRGAHQRWAPVPHNSKRAGLTVCCVLWCGAGCVSVCVRGRCRYSSC